MKDEIKEILEFLNIPMNESWACSLEDYQAHLLLDYITNLQEENIKLKSRNKSLSAENSYYKNIINELVEDIEFCLKSISQEKEMSTDERTRIEMESCKQILEERLKELKEGK